MKAHVVLTFSSFSPSSVGSAVLVDLGDTFFVSGLSGTKIAGSLHEMTVLDDEMGLMAEKIN